MNRVTKIQLTYDSDEMEYKDFCKTMFELMRDMRGIKNKTIQFLWSAENEMELLSDKTTKATTRKGKAYNYISNLFPRPYAANLCCAVISAHDRYKNDGKEVFVGTKSIASFKNNQPISLHNKSVKISRFGNEWNASLSLYSIAYKNELGLSKCSVPFSMVVKDNSTKTILERLLSGEYTISESQLSYHQRKKKWMLSLGYKQPKSDAKHGYNPDECRDNIMGLDLRYIYDICMSFNHCYDRYYIEGGEIEAFRKSIESRRVSLKRQRKHCGEGSIGHGYNTRMKPVLDIGDKINRFRNTVNHKYSRYIVEMAVKHHCGTINVEDLTGISRENAWLNNWSYYELQQLVKYKASAVGINVVSIPAGYTSQRCNKCGFITPDNKLVGCEFKCLECGYEAKANYNASQNIATFGNAWDMPKRKKKGIEKEEALVD